MEEEVKEGLDNFSWEEMNNGLVTQESVKEPITPPIESTPPTGEPPVNSEEKPKEESKEDKEKPEEEKPASTEMDDPDAKSLYEDWKNSGLISNVEFEEGTPITQENLLELIQEDRRIEVQSQLEQYFNELHPNLKALISYVQNGGDMNDYFNASQSEFNLNGDLKDSNYQNQIIRYYEKQLGSTDEEINDLITLLETGDKKSVRASKYHTLLSNAQKEQIASMEREQQAAAQRANQELKQHIESVTTELKKDNVLGVKLSPKDKSELGPYLIDRNVKLNNGITLTQFQYDLQEQLTDPSKLVFIANLVKNKLNLDKFIKNYTTQQTQYFRARIKTQEEKKPDNGSSNPFAGLNNSLT